MLNVNINTESISIAEINQLRKENENLMNKLVYFIKKYVEVRSLLIEGLQIIECFEEKVQQLEDKLFWEDETARLCNEGLNYRQAIEVSGI